MPGTDDDRGRSGDAARTTGLARWLPVLLATALIVAVGCAIGTPRSGSRGGTDSGVDRVVRSALADVERYWSSTFPQLSGGRAFRPLRGGYHPYTRTNLPPACGQQRPDYQPNAFYCPEGDFLAWDAETLIPQLYGTFGALLVGVVIAHEYGHAVQQRLDLIGGPTIVIEQQADCFAGAWVGDVNAGHAKGFDKPGPDQLDDTVAGLLQLRDQPGTPALAQQAHGNAFDRVRALQEGIEQGAAHCATYRADTLPVTEVPFSTREEAASGGDLPYSQAVTALSQDAQEYWTRTFPSLAGRAWEQLRVVPFDPSDAPACGGRKRSARDATNAAYYCAADAYVAFDNRQLGPDLYRNIGDNAVGMLLADLFAQAVQDRRGQPTEGRDGQLTIDCLAGSWTYDLLHRGADSDLRLSPGDLDEAVAALLVFGRAAKSDEATAFDRISAFRNSVLNGLSACR